MLLPEGKRFSTGPLNLTSNQALVVDGTLLASTNVADYPMVAPNYAKVRSSLAKKIGLGTKSKGRKK